MNCRRRRCVGAIAKPGTTSSACRTTEGEGSPDLARRCTDAGAFVTIVHPEWYVLGIDDALGIDTAHAVAVCNHSSAVRTSRSGGAAPLDQLGPRAALCTRWPRTRRIYWSMTSSATGDAMCRLHRATTRLHRWAVNSPAPAPCCGAGRWRRRSGCLPTGLPAQGGGAHHDGHHVVGRLRVAEGWPMASSSFCVSGAERESARGWWPLGSHCWWKRGASTASWMSCRSRPR
jgi:hypothetical protein